jgi:hypothetical protein
VCIGLDTPKAKIAVAVAEPGRSGKVRYLGEIANQPDAVQRLIERRCHVNAFYLPLLRRGRKPNTVFSVTWVGKVAPWTGLSGVTVTSPQEKLPIYLGFFQLVHNARRRGKALLGTLVAALVA